MNSVSFARTAGRLNQVARAHGVAALGFRSPPKAPDVNRSIRSERDGSVTVSVRMRGRPAMAVVADMIEGVVRASGLSGPAGAQIQNELWVAALGAVDAGAERDDGGGATVQASARASAAPDSGGGARAGRPAGRRLAVVKEAQAA